jgi:hypothetical protein
MCGVTKQFVILIMNNEKWGLDLPTQFWLATNRKCQSIANTKTGKGHFPRGWIELEEEEVSSAQAEIKTNLRWLC